LAAAKTFAASLACSGSNHQQAPPTGGKMAAGTERSRDNILPYSPLTAGRVSVTMPMLHDDSVTVAGDMRKHFEV
jgi:hypothetical protein